MYLDDLTGLGRLEAYLNILRRLRYEGVTNVAIAQLGVRAGRAVSVIAADLEALGITSSITTKHEINQLIAQIEAFLGWDNQTDAVLVGVGKLGAALMSHDDFRCANLSIIAAFDSAPAKIGQNMHGLSILPLAKLTSLVERLHISVGIIAVPAAEAQTIADLLVHAGIGYVINFTGQPLCLPPGIRVKDDKYLPRAA